MEAAQRYPQCQIIGIDYKSATLASLQECSKNLSFKHTIVHEGHTGLESFDDNVADHLMMRDVWLVNSPEHKWLDVLRQVYRVLKPGGYIEIYEPGKEKFLFLFLIALIKPSLCQRTRLGNEISWIAPLLG